MRESPVVPIRHRNSCSPAARYTVLVHAPIAWSLLLLAAPGLRAPDAAPGRIVGPRAIQLINGIHAQQVAVTISLPDGSSADVTSTSRYALQPGGVASVSASGLVSPVGDGEAVLTIAHGEYRTDVPVVVRNARSCPPVSYRN